MSYTLIEVNRKAWNECNEIIDQVYESMTRFDDSVLESLDVVADLITDDCHPVEFENYLEDLQDYLLKLQRNNRAVRRALQEVNIISLSPDREIVFQADDTEE